MAEGVRIGPRLSRDIKVVKNTQEKESWAGIAKMNLEQLDPNSAYRSYRMDAFNLSPKSV